MLEPLTAPHALLWRLIDYAGMYPPESLPLEEAVNTYLRHRRSPYEWMLGPFLCPSSQLHDLEWLLDNERLPIGVVFDQPAAEAVASIGASDLDITQVETTELTAADLFDLLNPALTVWLEADAHRVLETATRAPGRRIGVKIRCGGATADMFPTPAALAAAMHETFVCGLPFKATAGLHHPWRHYSDGLATWRHGFLNVAAAASLLVAGSGLSEAEAVLGLTQSGSLAPEGLKFGGYSLSVADLKSGRVFFRSYGSCSFDEPVDDLVAMGTLRGAR